MIQHHPSTNRLVSYAAGSLSFSQTLCISAHIEKCYKCRQAVKSLHEVGSELMANSQPAKVSDSLKSRVMSQIRQSDTDDSATHEVVNRASVPNSIIPRSLRSKLSSDDIESLQWKRLGFGIKTVRVCTDLDGSQVDLIRIPPGGKIPNHKHTGEETTIVLKGSFSDDEGIYNVGDLIVRNTEHNHRPTASQDSECVCLTVLQKPIHLTGWLGKIINPVIERSHCAS